MSSWRTTLLKSADALLGPPACLVLGRFQRLAGPDAPPPAEHPDISRILVIRPGGMGDMIVLLPVLELLRKTFPDASIRLVCEKRNIEVLRVAGLGDMAMAYDRNPVGLLLHLVRNRYDVVVDTEQFHHFSAVLGFLSRAKTRIGFKINPRRNPLYTHLTDYAPGGPEGEQFLKLMRHLGVEGTHELTGILAEANLQLPTLYDAKLTGALADRPFAVVHPCGYTPQKRWPADAFACVVRRLREKHGLGTVFVGGKADVSGAASILDQVKQHHNDVLSFAGQLDLSGTAALIKRASVFIGTDSGLAHLAVALGTRTVVLFGPSDHMKWGTETERHAIVRKEMPCAPCFIFGYHKPCRGRTCMTAITPDDVLAKVEAVME